MKTLNAIAVFAISVAGLVHAQDGRQQAAIEAKQQYVGAASPDVSTACAFTFTSGTGNKFMQYCVTKNGNIAQFQSPSGVQYISSSPIGEGYAFCDFDSSTQYYDYAGFGDSGNWQAPVTLSSSSTVVKIARTTSNGILHTHPNHHAERRQCVRSSGYDDQEQQRRLASRGTSALG